MDWQQFVIGFTLFVFSSTVYAKNLCMIEDKHKNVCIHDSDGNGLVRELQRYVNKELYTSYKYLHMAQHLSRADKAYHGFSKLFTKQSHEAAENADKLKEYFNKRATELKLLKIEEPKITTYHNLSYCVNQVLKHEKFLNAEILKIHRKADSDPHLQYFIEENFLNQKVELIKRMADLNTILNRLLGNHVGEHAIDDRLRREVWF